MVETIEDNKQKQSVNPFAVTKRALMIFLPLALLLAGVLGALYYTNASAEHKIIKVGEPQVVELQNQLINKHLKSVVSDVMILSQNHELSKLMDGHEESQNGVAREFFVFSEKRRCYDQVRYLDETGMEVVRINFNEGTPGRVPEDKLQNKAGRYYFDDAYSLDKGEVFVSPLDLNIERGVIERPLKERLYPGNKTFDSIWQQAKDGKYVKPMIRFGTPVFDSKGQKKGIVLVNFFAAQLINIFDDISQNSSGQCFLVNREGFWLKSPSSEAEWGFMREHDKNKNVPNIFPDVWEKISKEESGQFYATEGLFTFTTAYPFLEDMEACCHTCTDSDLDEAQGIDGNLFRADQYHWKIVSYIPNSVLFAKQNALAKSLIVIWVLLAVILASVSWFLGLNRIIKRQMEENLKTT